MSDSDAAGAPSVQARSGTNGSALSWADLILCALLCLGGFVFLRDAPHWGRVAYVGSAQYGDAEFWWNGALHFSHGIIAENPNLTYRMGYAAFGGLVVAVGGPDYRIFHQILVLLFLATSCGLYLSLRAFVGRIAAAAAVLFFVFNPFTAEWLAISTSDGLGLILNLAALLALIAGVQSELRLRWIAIFGVLLACGSLTRPLMTPFIAPAALAVIAAAWGTWRKVARTLGIMLAAFILPTVAWMAFMAATTGNFALTGASQDSSAFYAASDPLIQVWRSDMYVPVQESARKRFHVAAPTPRQINQEFWTLTWENYRKHWRYHLARLGRHTLTIAGFTPARSTGATSASERARTAAKWTLTGALAAAALWRRRWLGASTTIALGSAWALWPQCHAGLVLGASAFGLVLIFLGNRAAFLLSAYWWIGLLALYLTGGTWGPPLGPTHDLNALGYRLGFQSFFAGDLLVIFTLGCFARWQFRPTAAPESDHRGCLTRPSPFATRLGRIALIAAATALGLLLCVGAALVIWRLVVRTHLKPIAYPDIAALVGEGPVHNAQPARNMIELMVPINARAGARIVTPAMSSGFVWNLPGQQRCILLLYQQDFVQPVHMSPRRFDVEISQSLPVREWMGRQGAWLVRSFPDTAQVSNLPYYLEMPAVQAFIPLSADGKSYNTALATVFPLAKSATQLAASGELVFAGLKPEWAINSGPVKYARRFALRRVEATGPALEITLDLSQALGKKDLRFGIQLEAGPNSQTREQPCTLRLAPDPTADGKPLWQAALVPGAEVVENALSLDGKSGTLHFTIENLLPSDTLWFYEFALIADDFAP